MKSSILLFTFFLSLTFVHAQTQIGDTIKGTNIDEESGWDVFMPNAYTLAVGARELAYNFSANL